jgi:DNA-binding NarL/FixJ family response regulator
MTISILLVDDHDLIRGGLRRAFEAEPDFQVLNDAGTCAQALAAVHASKPNVTVLDVNLPDGSGMDLVPQLRELAPDMGIVVLTMYETDDHLFNALHNGASAFVAKGSPTSELLSAVRHAAASPHAFTSAGLAQAMQRRMTGSTGIKLTQREQDILALLKLGVPVNDIAAQLYISASTAKTHISKLYEKLKATNRTQAVVEAMRLGLLSSGDARTGATRPT